MRKTLVLLAVLAAMAVPAPAMAADKPSATLPDQELWPLAAYDLTIPWLIGTVQDATFSGATIRQTSDTAALTDPKKPPTTGEAVAILNGLVAELQRP